MTDVTLTEQIELARQLRERLVADPYRPIYHLVAPEGVCAPFDPNAAIYWKGRYHVMYIVQTAKGHCWGHVSSRDLVYWRHHPLALEPGGVDSGIFSGGVFVDEQGVPTITYWGLGEQAGICLATPADDELNVWVKHPADPVIHQTDHGLAVTPQGEPIGAADPSAVWRHNGRYYMMTGNLLVLRAYGLGQGQVEHTGDTTYLFVSDDLVHWEYLHHFYTSDRAWTQADEDNMCPDFFPLGDRHMLLFISHNLGCQYYIGRYEDDRFFPETHGRMTWVDNGFFAPESLVDDQGRRIMWAWIKDGRSKEIQAASGWSGTMSLPRVLWLGDDRTLRMAPPPELEALRTPMWHGAGLALRADESVRLQDVSGNTIELMVTIDPGSAAQMGVTVCAAPDGKEATRIYFDRSAGRLCIDTTCSSLGEGTKSVEAGPLELAAGEPLALRIFVDRSVVEVFANERQGVMRHIYPTRPNSVGVEIFAVGGTANALSVEAWGMSPANSW